MEHSRCTLRTLHCALSLGMAMRMRISASTSALSDNIALYPTYASPKISAWPSLIVTVCIAQCHKPGVWGPVGSSPSNPVYALPHCSKVFHWHCSIYTIAQCASHPAVCTRFPRDWISDYSTLYPHLIGKGSKTRVTGIVCKGGGYPPFPLICFRF